MVKSFFIVCFVGVFTFLKAQTAYFQQEVNYTIDVSLNDVSHELNAFESIQYINRSNTSLDTIYFHLWPNAYKNNETALAKQLLENGDTKFYFAPKEDLGYIDSLNFLVNGKQVKWEFDKHHIDICKLVLNTSLHYNDTIVITTPFHVKLPSAKLSRLGHLGQAYAIIQWYPKPAVFDKDGWHVMPYLNQGEFYSEFGAFDVKITVPKNYVLAATGNRIDANEEEEWLMQKAEETQRMIAEKRYSFDLSFPQSDKGCKTIRFKQTRVHDFAWFADKRFHVLKGSVNLTESGKSVYTWAFFTNQKPQLWSRAIEYLNDATLFYSKYNGDYPHEQITAVDGTISAGGGMEYPNITIIGTCSDDLSLETSIMHEVGHNWFYGILGSNERQYPFMDEGLNSFYEMRYLQEKYPKNTLASVLGRDSSFRFLGLNKLKYQYQYEFSYLLSARKNLDQPIFLSANHFTNYNYGAMVYSKSALAFNYLMRYVGQDMFDKAMKQYYQEWKFKHPSPTDLIQILQTHFKADLSWFENDLIKSSRKLDYKMVRYRLNKDQTHSILLKNKQEMISPFSISAIKEGKTIKTIWYDGFKGKQQIIFPSIKVDEFKIDAEDITIDLNRKNNGIRTSGLFKKSDPLQLSLIAKIDNPKYTQLNFLPLIAYNHYDRVMLGCAFYNWSFLQKKQEFTIAPLYGFGSKKPTGFADYNVFFLPNNSFVQQVTCNVKAKSFSYDYFDPNGVDQNQISNEKSFYLNYYKMSATIDIEFKKKNPRNTTSQHIGFTNNQILIDDVVFQYNKSNPEKYFIKKTNKYVSINNLYYQLHNERSINPYSFDIQVQHNNRFAKLSSELNYELSVSAKKSIDIRFFVGTFIYKSNQLNADYRFRMSGFSGIQDYLFNYNYVGRNENNGIGSAQTVEQDGAFKIWTPLGQTSKWLIALNMKSPTVGKLPMKLYLDFGTSEFNESLYKNRVLYNVGIDICIWKNIFEIFVPFAYSDDIRKALEANNKTFFDTIRFTLNLHNINPRKLITNSL